MNEALFAERMAALRAKQAASNPSPLSELRVPHKLATFLLIYTKSEYDCARDYMEGATYLLGYLTYGHTIPLDLELDKYPRIETVSLKIPKLLRTYEMVQLANLLSGETYGTNHHRYERALYLTTLDLINRGLI